jgi:hypothetical protein
MKRLITAAIATSLMTSTMPAAAQTYRDQAYREDNARYSQERGDYDRQMRDYEANRARYERDRADYDRRYGAGSFERYYGVFRDERPIDRYGDSRYSDRYDPYARYLDSPCERRSRSGDRTGGTVIGALIGGALGAAAAGDSSETEGAVLGAIVGGALGNNIAGNSSSHDRYVAKCDSRGYYFTYDQTIPYRERNWGRSGRYDTHYYSRQRCRLAPAPADLYGRVEYRYVRVCPDRNNRYRITS